MQLPKLRQEFLPVNTPASLTSPPPFPLGGFTCPHRRLVFVSLLALSPIFLIQARIQSFDGSGSGSFLVLFGEAFNSVLGSAQKSVKASVEGKFHL